MRSCAWLITLDIMISFPEICYYTYGMYKFPICTEKQVHTSKYINPLMPMCHHVHMRTDVICVLSDARIMMVWVGHTLLCLLFYCHHSSLVDSQHCVVCTCPVLYWFTHRSSLFSLSFLPTHFTHTHAHTHTHTNTHARRPRCQRSFRADGPQLNSAPSQRAQQQFPKPNHPIIFGAGWCVYLWGYYTQLHYLFLWFSNELDIHLASHYYDYMVLAY